MDEKARGSKESDEMRVLDAVNEAAARGETLMQGDLVARMGSGWDAPRVSKVVARLEEKGLVRRQQAGRFKQVMPSGASAAVVMPVKAERKAKPEVVEKASPVRGRRGSKAKSKGVPKAAMEAQARARAKLVESEGAAPKRGRRGKRGEPDAAEVEQSGDGGVESVLEVPEKPKPAMKHPATMDPRLAKLVAPSVVDVKAEAARQKEREADAKVVGKNLGKSLAKLSEDETLAYNGFLVNKVHESYAFLESLASDTTDKAAKSNIAKFLQEVRRAVAANAATVKRLAAERAAERVGEKEGIQKDGDK